MPQSAIVFEHLHLILLFGLLALVTHWLAWSKGFFILREAPVSDVKRLIQGKQIIIVFAIYLLVSLLVAPMLAQIYPFNGSGETISPFVGAGLLQLFSLLIVLASLILFALKQNRTLMKKIWIEEETRSRRQIWNDLLLGILTWFVAFPLVVTVGQICDLLLYVFLGVESYEQVAVRFLKLALSSPLLLTVALFTIIITAPIIEEWLFRGFLQTFFRKYLGRKAAILLASLCFSLFHLSGSQGWGNISLAISLFVFSLYLGFIYERQGSLFAPIALHSTFNTISTLRVLLMPDQ